jgi:hypothetical protein
MLSQNIATVRMLLGTGTHCQLLEFSILAWVMSVNAAASCNGSQELQLRRLGQGLRAGKFSS